jgi:hypothetical protein
VLIGNGPGSPYMGIQHAVGVAQPGDVVLVRLAITEGITVSKGITLVADVPGRLTWSGVFRVQGVPAGETFLLSGFNLGLASSTPLVITGNAGAVRIQDCGVLPIPVPNQGPTVGVTCDSSSDVAFLNCGITGGSGPGSPFTPTSGALGLSLIGSTVTIQGSDVGGGYGLAGTGIPPSGPTPGTGGGPAVRCTGGTLLLQHSNVHGGRGGNGSLGSCGQFFPSAGGAGGKGLTLLGGAVARAIGGRTLGGAGGVGGTSTCAQAPNGATGLDVDASGGTLTRIQSVDRTFTTPRIVRVGTPLTLGLHGVPDEHAYLVANPVSAFMDIPAFEGVLLAAPDFRRVEYGVVGADGSLVLPLTTPAVPGAGTNDLMHVQPLMLDALGGLHLGCASIVIRVDASN